MAYLPDFSQSHYVIYELVLPYCTVCTPRENVDGIWHTPPLCVESSDAEYSLFFGYNNLPFVEQPRQAISGKSILNSKIWRCISSSSVSTSKAKAGGLASRGTMSFIATDIEGDPGPIEFTDQGTLFGKLMARNILEGKKIITHYYAIGNDGETPVEVRTETHYVTNAALSAGVFTLNAKDALKDLEAFSQQYPIPGEVTLTADIDASQTTFAISDATNFPANTYFRIDGELFRVASVVGNDITVDPRGHTRTSSIDGRILYKSDAATHSADSTLQTSRLLDGEPLADTLEAIFNAVGLGAFVDYTQWNDDITQWDGDALLWGIMSEPTDASDLVDDLLQAFLVDMWLDQDTQKAFVSTNSNWKQPKASLVEGDDVQDYKVTTKDNTRFSRAYILAGKAFQAENDDSTNYSRLISSSDVESESSDFYGSVKLKEFDPVQWLSGDSALRLTSRYIQRYSDTPREVTFKMEERKVKDLRIGDVVSVLSIDKQSPSGAVLTSDDRLQILKLQPVNKKPGRQYTVNALAYTPLFASDPSQEQFVTITGSIRSINLATYVGAPTNIPLNYTFIFDGCEIGSAEEAGTWLASVRAGAWHPDSRIRIICTNNTAWSAKGGDGGSASAATRINNSPIVSTGDGNDGSISYDSGGIKTDLYFNYSSIEGYNPSSLFYASGGGSGGAASTIQGAYLSPGSDSVSAASAAGGSGGSGIPVGIGGLASASSYQADYADSKSITGNDGEFDYGGGSLSITSNAGIRNVSATSNTGFGGSSSSASTSSTSTTNDPGLNDRDVGSSVGAPGLAGLSITGALDPLDIKVYNLASESGRFKPGRSVAGVDYTLIDS